jgi:AcrR family transcriptional regulator
MSVMTRAVPRQQRSEASIERLIDAAERVIDRVGAGRVTTALVAAEAGVSVGRVYYWFPDVAALVRAVGQRSAEHLIGRFAAHVRPLGDISIDHGVKGLVGELMAAVWANPSVARMLADARVEGAAADGGRLRTGLLDAVKDLLTAHVDGLAGVELDAVATVVIELVVGGVAAAAVADPVDGLRLEREVVFAVIGYLYARFPAAGDPVWTEQGHRLRPSAPARRRAWSPRLDAPSSD